MDNIHGGDIYSYENVFDFSANINPLPVPPDIINAAQLKLCTLMYYPDMTCRKLRNALAEYYELPEDFFICGNGAADLIFTLVYARKPKTALTLAPSFLEYEAALRAAGTGIRRFMLSEQKDFALQDSYIDALTDDLDMAFLCVPNNPTGAMIEKEQLSAIAKRCREKQILLVLDECFLDFLPQPLQYSLLEETRENEYLVILKSFTKMFALAGLRLGFAVTGNKRLIEQMYRCRQPWPVSGPAEEAGIAALKETEFVIQSRQYIQQEAAYLKQELEKLVQKVYMPSANFVFWKDASGLFEKFLAQGILIRDCKNYPGLGNGYYRAAVKRHVDNERFIKTLAKICGH